MKHHCLKSSFTNLELLADIDMLLLVEKSIRWGIWHAIYQYAKANNKQLKDYDKNKESSYFKYCDVNNLYGWPITQKLPVNKFEWIKDTASLNENFIKRKWLMIFSQSCSLIFWRITWFS